MAVYLSKMAATMAGSTIFTSANKSYLTYPYPTRGVDKKRIRTRVVNILVV